MNLPESKTIEQVLLERLGVSVEDAIATGTDIVDETVARAADSGMEVDDRLAGLSQLIEKLTEPSMLSMLGQLLDSLPELVQLAKLASDMPDLFATLVDVLDSYQQKCADAGIDVEKAIANGLHSILYLGSRVDMEHLGRIGDLLASDILNPHALNVVDNAARSLNTAQEQVCGAKPERIGAFGLLRAMRDPQIQRSLAFMVQFGKCFGRNLDQKMGENQHV